MIDGLSPIWFDPVVGVPEEHSIYAEKIQYKYGTDDGTYGTWYCSKWFFVVVRQCDRITIPIELVEKSLGAFSPWYLLRHC